MFYLRLVQTAAWQALSLTTHYFKIRPDIVYHDPAKKLVVFSRTYAGEKIWVVLNRSEAVQRLDLTKWTGKKKVKNRMSGETISASKLQVKPMSGLILK